LLQDVNRFILKRQLLLASFQSRKEIINDVICRIDFILTGNYR